MSIKRPQKAPSESITDSQLEELFKTHEYLLGSPKLDGFRCTCDNAAHTSTMKLVKNEYAQNILSDPKYNGLDGELLVGKPNDKDAFANTKGAVTRTSGKPDFKLYVYDTWFVADGMGYKERTKKLQDRCKDLPYAVYINQIPLYSPTEVKAFEDAMVFRGYEGAMIRSPDAPYKEGRTTLKEQNIFKRKPMEDDEGIIVGFEEQMKNLNKKTKNEMGNSTRSSHKANKIGKGTMGAIWLRSKKWDKDFKVSGGKGIDNKFRQWLWDNRESLIGKIITYKYQRYGSIDAPRIPTYKAFRDKNDITDY